MKNARRVMQNVLTAADFPGDILTGVPSVELKGDSEASIVGHRGVIAYSTDEVSISSVLGRVQIRGHNLVIFRMNRERIVIHGRVCSICIERASEC